MINGNDLTLVSALHVFMTTCLRQTVAEYANGTLVGSMLQYSFHEKKTHAFLKLS